MKGEEDANTLAVENIQFFERTLVVKCYVLVADKKLISLRRPIG